MACINKAGCQILLSKQNGCLSTCMPAMATPSGRPWDVDYYQRASSCAVRGVSRVRYFLESILTKLDV